MAVVHGPGFRFRVPPAYDFNADSCLLDFLNSILHGIMAGEIELAFKELQKGFHACTWKQKRH